MVGEQGDRQQQMVGEEEQQQQLMLAPGVRFDPSDVKLIFQYLCPRVLGLPLPTKVVLDGCDIYKKEPWFLPTVDASINGGINGQYYFTLRNQQSSKRMSRVVTQPQGHGGWWNNSSNKSVCDKNGCIWGTKTTFNFFLYKDNQNRSSKNGVPTTWIMHEYSLPTYQYDQGRQHGQEIVLCKIRDKTKD